MAYAVRMTEYARLFIENNVMSESMLARFDWAIEILGTFPSFGPAYEPDYPAARPPFPCRYLPLSDAPFTLYYIKDDDAETLTIIDVEWSAGDPRKRFSAL